jgi:hypothetical protein
MGLPHWLRPIYLIDVKRWRCWCEHTVPTTFAICSICTFTLAWALAQLTALKAERQRFFSSLLTEVNTLLDGGIGKPLS